MIVVEVVAGVLVAASAIVVTMAGITGLLGILGAIRFVRCDRCRRLGISSPSLPLRSCVQCRHGLLLHPFYVRHHADASVARRDLQI